MEISVYSIQKNSDEFKEQILEYIKMSKKYAKINDTTIFNDKIAKAQAKSKDESLLAYDSIYEPKIKGFCIALDESGDMLDSKEFAQLISSKSQISFFIGGAYGLSGEFKKKMDRIVSLSRLTLAHKIAKLMLHEQIFRGLCINANHPYHK
ncbi:23S rRNA (pseudouridine(1915)-N(3))-methyltransferase RlmH [Campylobacter geochelonis]|uniref:Ribosomal RNA large subunit methyltransferase H n=1 Tax=Campylobacter geochelonis TaxID=1780362 RepID=A0A128ENB7_9BACT|nr:23S rRNA (pseudouridine(1915)-N(3))-methyltransferase RlmH [Campylobacter geochelonis]QKF70716.1 SPOUT methyltransferase [Campylobacter geochelonis]CZE45733.1 ribosomal RNA large subunit methyltransferase H [Campylobacter geochelonis]CZE46917.1 ribosomal RNA large subunit methyltransferase H [Campylobacter geochelonis]CZE50239.1 ribosomal RNA large subunit methyltransferase H [Campylobacter geochelonis]